MEVIRRQSAAFSAAPAVRAGGEPVRAYLHLDLGVCDQVEVPLGVLPCSALRRDDDVAVAVAAVDQRCAPELPGLPAARREQERVDPHPALPLAAVALDVAADVLSDPADGAVRGLGLGGD